jgi:hypothetical protein
MVTPKMVAYDESQTTKESQLFAADLFERYPEFRQYAAMERVPGSELWSLVVTIPAPSGDPKAQLTLWVDNGIEPSLEFGYWHTHGGLWRVDAENFWQHTSILDLVEAILSDRIILCEDVGVICDGFITTIIDLAVKDALLDELTSKYSPGRAHLRSWSGRLDRLVDITNLSPDDLD